MVNAQGVGYTVGDVLTISGGTFAISAEIASVGGRSWLISGRRNFAASAAIVTSQAAAVAQPKP